MSRAVRYDAFGTADGLYLAEVVDAAPGAGEVAVRVRAAGLNPIDFKLRRGHMAPPEPVFPRGTGIDLAGTVEAAGPAAAYADGTRIAVGDEVLGWGEGSVAERLLVPAAQLVRRPESVPVEVAGSLAVAGFAALSCLRAVPLGAGDTVLVGGAAGGVGLVYAQLAVRLGARVVGTASRGNHELLRSLGVLPVEYGEPLAERVEPFGPFSAAMDFHGRETVDAALALGVPRDRVIALANHAAVADLGIAVAPRLRSAVDLAWLADEVVSGELRLPIAASFPLDEVVAAFETLESSHAPGKVVVLP